ncbi:MAG: dihydrolipoamide acetyltransferase family protein, partial [Caldilinea sp.]
TKVEAVKERPTINSQRVRISPLARKLAEELDVDLSQVQGTGPHGAIDKADVERAAEALKARAAPSTEAAVVETEPAAEPKPTPAAAPVERPKDKGSADFQAGMRRAIALAMARANRDIPHYDLETRIDMTNALAWLEAENLQRSIQNRILPAVLLIKAVAKALTKVPQLNGYWVNDALQVAEGIHIGFAIALRQGGLITPALHHADLKSADELMENLRDLIMRTRAGRLRSSELTNATITVTSLGDMGVEKVFGVIYPPQVALVGFGKVIEEVWVEKGMIGVRPVVHATLAGDHRATDGRVGAEFLDVLNKLLQEPAMLFGA